METDKCECPELEELFQLRAEAEDLEGRCEVMESSVDLESFGERNVGNDELQRAVTYHQEARGFQEAVEKYQTEVGKLFSSGKLRSKGQNDTQELYCSGCGVYVDEISTN